MCLHATRAAVRATIARGHGELVLDDPVTLSVGRESGAVRPVRIDIAKLTTGLKERASAYRRRNPELWTGTAWIPASEAAEEGRG
jgi:hypothetical protein